MTSLVIGPSPSARSPWAVLPLVLAQGLNVLAVTVVLTFSTLAARDDLGQRGLALLPVTILAVAAALATFPAAGVMLRWGERAVLVGGAAFGAAGAALCAWAIRDQAFVLYTIGHAGLGIFQASAMRYRFAAAELGGAGDKAHGTRSISWVIGGGILAAFLGPNFATWSRALTTTGYLGSFAAVAVLLLSAAGLLFFVRNGREQHGTTVSGRSLRSIIGQPVFLIAALNGSLAYVVMSYVMSAAPLAVVAGGHGAAAAATVTRWHLIGMFAPSFFTGRLVSAIGVPRLLACAIALLFASAALGAADASLMALRLSLLGLGAGWNLLFVGATVLLATAHRPEESARAQAANDFLVLGSAAAATFAAGAMHSAFGWSGINLSVLPILALAGGAALRLPDPHRGKRKERR